MKKLLFTNIILLSILLFGCKDSPSNPDQKKVDAVEISYIRTGGGNKEFTIDYKSAQNEIYIHVSRYNFKTVSKDFTLINSSENEQIIGTIKSILNGEVNLLGDYKPTSAETGTWVTIYSISKDGDSTEVTNTTLRNDLLPIEKIIDAQMK